MAVLRWMGVTALGREPLRRDRGLLETSSDMSPDWGPNGRGQSVALELAKFTSRWPCFPATWASAGPSAPKAPAPLWPAGDMTWLEHHMQCLGS